MHAKEHPEDIVIVSILKVIMIPKAVVLRKRRQPERFIQQTIILPYYN